MKNSIYLLFFLILVFSATAEVWESCPFGETDCPGLCGRFVDTDGDALCDYSQPSPEKRAVEMDAEQIEVVSTDIAYENDPSPEAVVEDVHDIITGEELKTKTVEEVALLYGIDTVEYAARLTSVIGVVVKPSDGFQFLHDNYGLTPSVAKDIAENFEMATVTHLEKTNRTRPPYRMLEIAVFLTLGYVLTWGLSKKKILSDRMHKQIWNILLTISFFVMASLSILLVVRVNYGWTLPLPFNILYWHVESGTAVVIISIFHAAWHWKYYASMFKIKSSKNYSHSGDAIPMPKEKLSPVKEKKSEKSKIKRKRS